MIRLKKKELSKKKWKKCLAMVFLVSFIVFWLFESIPVKKVQAAVNLQNPREDSEGVVTWDCIYFGNYPQSDSDGEIEEPIKWRVLSVDGNDAFLVADQNLDVQKYNNTYSFVTWKNSTMRSWLNGYGSSSNMCGISYINDSFIDTAFTASEKSVIKTTYVVNDDNPQYGTDGGSNTYDKVFLLSYAEVTNPAYGFSADYSIYDNARIRSNTAYVAEGGSIASDYMNGENAEDYWWLRSPGYDSDSAMNVHDSGYVNRSGYSVDSDIYAVCPALHLNLSSSNLWSYAGTVSSDGNVTEAVGVTGIELNKSRLSMTVGEQITLEAMVKPSNADDKTMVWSSSDEGIAEVTQDGIVTALAAGRAVITVTTEDGEFTDSCVVEIATATLKNPRRDVNGAMIWDCVYFGNYPQSDKDGYSEEPIKWRVLSVQGNNAFLVADQNLDVQKYNNTGTSVTWKNCTMRSWLNGYGSSYNVCGIDFSNNNFIDRAFTDSEQNAIKTTYVVNDNNLQYGTDGGSNTHDKVFLLSYTEVTNPAYGFFSDASVHDEARKRMNTAYVASYGGSMYDEGSVDWWWLRSPGDDSDYAMYVNEYGYIGQDNAVNSSSSAVCPALYLNIAVSNIWSYAGTEMRNCNHEEARLENRNKVEPTCTQQGYSGDIYCTLCQTLRKAGEKIAATGHDWDAGTVIKEPTITESGIRVYHCKKCSATKQDVIAPYPDPGTTTGKEAVAVGDTKVIYVPKEKISKEEVIDILGVLYKVTSIDNRTLSCIGLVNKDLTSLKLWEQVEIEGSTYIVTDIGKGAFRNNKKLQEVIIGKDVISISDQAFYGCTGLRAVTFNTSKLSKVGNKAFKGIKNAKSYVKGKKVSVYRKLVNNSNRGTCVIASQGIFRVTNTKKKKVSYIGTAEEKKTTIKIPATIKIDGKTYKVTSIASDAFKNNKKVKKVTIGKSVTTIGKNAFTNCKKLRKIIIQSRSIKKVGISKISGKITIVPPSGKEKKYKKLFLKSFKVG